MTVIGMTTVLIIGIVMMGMGLIMKKRWLTWLSIIPLAIVAYQVLLLFAML